MNNYDDIINLQAFHDPDFPRLSPEDRAMQFSPYKSLNGFENKILETEENILSNEEREIIDFN